MCDRDIATFGLFDRMFCSTDYNSKQIRLMREALQPYAKILDVCAGFGNLTRELLADGKQVYALDVKEMPLAVVPQA